MRKRYFKSTWIDGQIKINKIDSKESEDAQRYVQKLVPTDPLDFTNLEELLPNNDTRKKYLRKWTDFVEFSGISKTCSPTEELFLAYLEKKHSDGYINMLNLYSSLNTIFLYFYGSRLDVSRVVFQTLLPISKICIVYKN